MIRTFILLAAIFMLASCKQQVVYDVSEPVYEQRDSVFKANIELTVLAEHFDGVLGVEIHGFGAFDVYWDGVHIGRNGQPAALGKPEVPGTECTYYQVPDTLSGRGKHVVTIQGTQTWHRDKYRDHDAKLESYVKQLQQPLIELSLVNLMAGAFLIAAIYYAFLYYNSKRRQLITLLFGVICLLFFLLLFAEYFKLYVDIPYTDFYIRLRVIGWLTFAISVLVPLYFTIYFGLPYKKWITGMIVMVLLGIYFMNYGHYDLTAYSYGFTLWIVSVLILLYAIWKKQKGAYLVLAGFIASMVVNQFLYFDFALYVAFTIIVVCILYLQTIRAKQLEEDHERTLLMSSRLQLELVRKNIQPHFLRNTLTSLIDWVEESPADGVKFIQALSGEFDIMNEIAEELLIPVRQEIDLCEHHLQVMAFRKEVDYIWEEANIDETELIPPAVIHTLLENGITHSMPLANGTVKFKLNFSRIEKGKQYTFETFAQNRLVTSERKGGNGLKYIEARLTESYGDKWQLTSHTVSYGWVSIIKIFA